MEVPRRHHSSISVFKLSRSTPLEPLPYKRPFIKDMAFAAINNTRSTGVPIAVIEDAFATDPSLKKRVYDAIGVSIHGASTPSLCISSANRKTHNTPPTQLRKLIY